MVDRAGEGEGERAISSACVGRMERCLVEPTCRAQAHTVVRMRRSGVTQSAGWLSAVFGRGALEEEPLAKGERHTESVHGAC